MQAMNLTLDTARDADLPQLVELLGLLFAQEVEFTPNSAKQERALRMILADPRVGRIYVARDAGKVLAMLSVLESVSTAEGGRAGLLEDMVVRPELRGQGIGARLLEYAVEQSRAAGLLRLTLLTDSDNERARGLYAEAGFQFSPMRPMRIKL
jgi:GNAT superfamily N-acetyltransferase